MAGARPPRRPPWPPGSARGDSTSSPVETRGGPRSATGSATSCSTATTVPPTLRAEMLLYMASRAQLVEDVIRPALEAGRVVVSDRFLLANVVYQGFAGGLPVDEVWRVGQVATGGLLPDLTLLLDVPTSLARARVGPARDRIEDRPESYHAEVREGFLRAAREGRDRPCPDYPAPIVVIDASADPEVVAGRIQSEVERALALDPRS